MVINRFPLFIDRGTGVLAIVKRILIIGQFFQIGQRLKQPRFGVEAAAAPGLGHVQKELRCLVLVGIVLCLRHRPQIKLQGLETIALERVDKPAALPLMATVELAGDDRTEVFIAIQQRLSGRLQESPIFGMHGDHAVAKIVNFVHSAEVTQRVDTHPQVVTYLHRIVLGIERQQAKPHVGIFEVAVFEALIQLGPLRRRAGICRPDERR